MNKKTISIVNVIFITKQKKGWIDMIEVINYIASLIGDPVFQALYYLFSLIFALPGLDLYDLI